MNYLYWTNNYSIDKNSEYRWKYAKITDNKTHKCIAFNIIEYVSPDNSLFSYDGVYYFRLGTSQNISVELYNTAHTIIPLTITMIEQYSISDTNNINNADFFILSDIDKELVPLLVRMNNIRGISTFWSCSGHSYKQSVIVFKDTFDYMKRNYQKWIDSFDLITLTGTDPYYSLVELYKPGYKINSNCFVTERIDKSTANMIKATIIDTRTIRLLCSHNIGTEAYKDIKILANNL